LLPESDGTPVSPVSPHVLPPEAHRPGEHLTAQTITEISGQLESLRLAARRMERERDEAKLRERHLRFVRDLAHRAGGRMPLDDFLRYCADRVCALLRLQDCAIVLMGGDALVAENVAVARDETAAATWFAADGVTRHVLLEAIETEIADLSVHPRDGEQGASD
jgi:hypothetical protein